MATDKPSLPPPTLAQYPELILGAIEALNDENGANTAAISKHIESTYGELPAAHSTLLSHHLNRMKQSGELVMFKGNYMKPDPTRTSRPGPGRPAKDKNPPAGDAVTPSRKRGRPAKLVSPDGNAPATETTPRPRGRPKSAERAAKLSVSPRPRGRPARAAGTPSLSISNRPRGRPAKAKGVDGLTPMFKRRGRPAKAASSGPSRPRGRPPKSVNAESPSAKAPSVSPRPRGRPKSAKPPSNAKAPSTSPRPRGRPRNVEAEAPSAKPSSRPRGRPRNLNAGVAKSPPRPRGRPSKSGSAKAPPSASPRPRGRPAKSPGPVSKPTETVNVDSENYVSLPVTDTPSRKRGRPKKSKKSGDDPLGSKRGRGRPTKIVPTEAVVQSLD